MSRLYLTKFVGVLSRDELYPRYTNPPKTPLTPLHVLKYTPYTKSGPEIPLIKDQIKTIN
ncbi:hypothetical protein HanIR_Chr01g0012511 [Helianthus annuus]|nr:hypothetical protein HanIR_Chr01g0012511 [Helianthus annuus]